MHLKPATSDLCPALSFPVCPRKKTEEISNIAYDIQCFLHDYRIELMNTFLVDIFDKKVPERQPLPPYKTLKQVATKEFVKKELNKRENEILYPNSEKK